MLFNIASGEGERSSKFGLSTITANPQAKSSSREFLSQKAYDLAAMDPFKTKGEAVSPSPDHTVTT